VRTESVFGKESILVVYGEVRCERMGHRDVLHEEEGKMPTGGERRARMG
jgi:hypothetical protein